MKKICMQCENEITGSGVRFCSLRCSNLFREPTISRVRETRVCVRKECLESFEVVPSSSKKYCSRSCAAKVNNQGVSRHNKSVTCCPRCSKPTGSRNRKYCSRECYNLFKIESWLAGELDANNKYHISEWARRYVFERAEWQCQGIGLDGGRCKENRKKPSGGTVLTIDHIDGNWQNSWSDNLRALCPTCHALTPNYGAANMGNGRTWKKKYNQYQPRTLTEDLGG